MTDTSTARPYTEDDRTTMIKMISGGATWEEVAAKLGRGVEAVQRASSRMRDAGKWPDVPDAVRELPKGPGRPRNRKPSKKISPRFSPSVSSAVREVAAQSSVRTGQVLEEAVRQYIETNYKQGNTRYLREEATLQLLQAGDVRELEAYPREETMSVSILQASFEAIGEVAERGNWYVSAVIVDAVHALLAELGYTFGGEE